MKLRTQKLRTQNFEPISEFSVLSSKLTRLYLLNDVVQRSATIVTLCAVSFGRSFSSTF